jgi:hypothetical protein
MADSVAKKPAEKVDPRPVVPVTEMHKALATFEGDWKISQRFFEGPNSKPVHVSGRTRCRVILDGRAVYMESELENGYKAIVITTWNPTSGRYEGFFMDVHSFDGFDPLMGMPMPSFPTQEAGIPRLNHLSPPEKGRPERRRVWNSRLTVPRMTSLGDEATRLLAGVDSLPAEIVEYQVSEDEWTLLCVSLDAAGEQFVMMENTYTRA